jgi:hypothetical protein
MNRKDADYLKAKIDSEGFDYCFVHYSSFNDIKDDKFHELRLKYLTAQRELRDYIDEFVGELEDKKIELMKRKNEKKKMN